MENIDSSSQNARQFGPYERTHQHATQLENNEAIQQLALAGMRVVFDLFIISGNYFMGDLKVKLWKLTQLKFFNVRNAYIAAASPFYF